MKTTEISTSHKRKSWTLSLVAFILFLIGLFLSFISMAVRQPEKLLMAAAFALFLALIFGVMTWSKKLGKIGAIGAADLCSLAVIRSILFYLIR